MQAALPTTPSSAKFGTLVLQHGYTQHPRSVADYLNTLHLCPREKDLGLSIFTIHRSVKAIQASL